MPTPPRPTRTTSSSRFPNAVGQYLAPIITMSQSVRDKITTKKNRNLTTTPLGVLILGDSNDQSGVFHQGAKSARHSTYDWMVMGLNNAVDGFNTGQAPYSWMIVQPGPTPNAEYLGESLNAWRWKTSTNMLGAAGPVPGAFMSHTSCVQSNAGGTLAFKMDRRQSITVKTEGQHEIDRLAVRMKLVRSIGKTAGANVFDGNYGNTNLTTLNTDVITNNGLFHADLTLEFWDMIGAAKIGSTIAVPSTYTTATPGTNWYYDGWTTDWITLPDINTYPYIEIRVIQPASSRNMISALVFDTGSGNPPKVKVANGAVSGRGAGDTAGRDYLGDGTASTDQDSTRARFGATIAALYQAPNITGGITLTGAPTHYPLFAEGLDYIYLDVLANDSISTSHLRFQARINDMVTRVVADQPNVVVIINIPIPRGRVDIATLDGYITGTQAIDGQNVSFPLMVQAMYNVQAAFSNNVVIQDFNAAYNRAAGVTQLTATQLQAAFFVYNDGDAMHHDSWYIQTNALSAVRIMSGKAA